MTAGHFFNKPDMSLLEELTHHMKEAYSDGFEAMDQAGSLAVPDMQPDHEIDLAVKLTAHVDGHVYHVDSKIVFDIELEPLLTNHRSPMAELVSALSSAGVDLGEDADAVVEQLARPRALGTVRGIEIRELELHGTGGRIEPALNEKGMLLITITGGRMMINCENVFTYPNHPDAFAAVPSMEAMQEHIIIDMEHMTRPVNFEWTEPDKDNLHVTGSVVIRPLPH